MRHILLALSLLAAPAALAQAGLPDPHFGTDGVARLEPQDQAEGWAAQTLADGRVRVAGMHEGTAVVYGFDDSGAPDAAFGVNGVASTGRAGMHAVDPHVFPSGRIVVVARPSRGSTVTGSALVGLRADGTLDPDFGDGGTVASATYWLALAADGDGFLTVGNDLDSRSGTVARFEADGTPDLSYGTEGRARPLPDDPELLYQTPTDIAVDASGRAVVVGASARGPFDARLVAARLTPSGAPDPTFGAGGVARPDVLSSSPAPEWIGMALDAQHRVVLTNGGSVSHLDAQGDLDPSYGTGGTVWLGTDGSYPRTSRVLVQPDGKIVVAGDLSSEASGGFLAARLTASGALDATFGAGGVTVLPTAGERDYEYEWAFGLAPSADGGVVLAGHRSSSAYTGDRVIVARLTGDVGVAAASGPVRGALALAHRGADPSRQGRVAVRLAHAGAVRATVHDALGRTVSVLHDGPLGAGEHAFAVGAPVPGVYLVRAVSADGAAAVLAVTVSR